MWTGFLIVIEVRTKNTLQVSCVQYDDMVEALSTYTADQAFNVRILPWRARSRDDFLDAHVLDPLAEELAVDRVTISN